MVRFIATRLIILVLLLASCAGIPARDAGLAPPTNIDQQAGWRVWLNGASCRVPTELRNGRLMVELNVWHGDPARPESTRIRASVDTGAQHGLILSARSARLLGLRPESEARFAIGAAGARAITRSTVMAADLGGARFENVSAVIQWSAPASGGLQDGGREGASSDENGLDIVGMGLLGAFPGVGIDKSGSELVLAFGEPAQPGPGWVGVPMHGCFGEVFSPAFTARADAEAWLASQGRPTDRAAHLPESTAPGAACRLDLESEERPMPRAWATIDDERIELVLDTGCSQDLYLFQPPQRWRIERPMRSSSAQDGHDRVFVQGWLEAELALGPLRVARPMTCCPAEAHAVDGMLGMFGRGLIGLETLTRRPILFDWKRQTLWIWDGAGPPTWPTEGPGGAGAGVDQPAQGEIGDWRIGGESATMAAWTSSPFKPLQG